MRIAYTVDELVRLIGDGRVEGHASHPIAGIAALKQAKAGDLAFLGNLKYKADVPTTKASLVLVPEEFEGKPAEGQAYIRLANPSLALGRICREIERLLWPKPAAGIHPSAVVAKNTKIDPTAHIGPLCVIATGASIGAGVVLQAGAYVGHDVQIGEDCWLMPHTSVMDYCVLGQRVRLHAGAVIGSDGFGYETNKEKGGHEKISQIGRVVVENDVEIGANTTVDRARFSETRIGEGTKIDNLVQIAHNVVIGKHCLIVAQVGISGSTTLEDYVVVGGQAGLTGHLRIGAGSQIGAQSGVTHDLEPKSFVRDSPAMPYMIAQKVHVLKSRLPDLFKRVASIEETIAQLHPGASAAPAKHGSATGRGK